MERLKRVSNPAPGAGSRYIRLTTHEGDGSYEFRVLGPLEAARGGVTLTLGGARQRTLLALLLVHANEVVSSERLVDELWGAEPPQTASTALHGVVSQLRRALDPEYAPGADGSLLTTRSPGYVLRVDRGALDAARFERLLGDGRAALAAGDAGRAATLLREALGLWHGRALDGVDGPPSVRAEALRLEALRLEAVEARVDADLALGRDEELVPELEGLAAREPLREKPQAQLVLALYRAGRQADALAHYQRVRATLADRLGLEPGPRLKELEQAMLRQDPELDAGLPRLRPRRVLRRRRRAVAVVASVTGLAVAGGVTVFLSIRPAAPRTGEPGSVAMVDAATGRVVDTIEVGAGLAAVAFGHDSVWVASAEDGTVSRIDPSTHEVVKVIGVESPVDLAIGRDAVWVAGGISGEVTRIDPETNRVVADIDLSGDDPLHPLTVQGVAADARWAWAVRGDELVRLDQATNRIDGELGVSTRALAVSVGHGFVWVATGGERLLRIEPRRLVVTARSAVPGQPFAVRSLDDGIAVLTFGFPGTKAKAWLVAPETARIFGEVPVVNASSVADVRGDGYWASTWDGMVARVSPRAARSSKPVPVGNLANALAVGADAVWVAVADPEPEP